MNGKRTQFKEGNKFWQIRSKHGRDKLFESPELLYEAASEFFKWCDDNPEIVIEISGGKKVKKPIKRPYTIQGLCIYLGANTFYLKNFKLRLKQEKSQLAADFLAVIQDIEDAIYNQKFIGAATYQFHANIIARDLGLKDKVETQPDIPAPTMFFDMSKMSVEDLIRIEKELEQKLNNSDELPSGDKN